MSAERIWNLVILKGQDLFALDTFVHLGLVTAIVEDGESKITSLSSRVATPVIIENPHPVWNFKALSGFSDHIFNTYQGVKISCFQHNVLINEPIGEGILWFKDVSRTKNQFKLIVDLFSGEERRGKVFLQSYFTKGKTTEETSKPILLSARSAHDLSSYTSRMALEKSDLVRMSTTGKRQVMVPTSKMERLVCFSELPPLDLTIKKRSSWNGFDVHTALWLITCANLAYKDKKYSEAVCLYVWDMIGFAYLDNQKTDTQAICTHNEEFIIISFRGTETVQDWATNLNFVLVEPSLPDRFIRAGVRVHNGFNGACLSVLDDVKAFIDQARSKYGNLKILLAGHSLGGALATLCLAYLTMSNQPLVVEALYTVGQPCAGNRYLIEQLKISAPNTTYIRMTNNRDIVPHVAPGQHGGTNVHFDAFGHCQYNASFWRKAKLKAQSISHMRESVLVEQFLDHSCPVYRKVVTRAWADFITKRVGTVQSESAQSHCDVALLCIDMMQEDVKLVLYFKTLFRVVLFHLLKFRDILQHVKQFLLFGIDCASEQKLFLTLVPVIQWMGKYKDNMMSQQKKKCVLSETRRHRHKLADSLNDIGRHMERLTEEIRDCLHNVSIEKHTNQNEFVPEWLPAKERPTFKPSLFEPLPFRGINFREIKGEKDVDLMHVVQVLGECEFLIDKGELEEAHKFLDFAKRGGIGVLQSEDIDFFNFLTAKLHAKSNHTEEALAALAKMHSSVDVLLDDPDFSFLKGNEHFEKMAKASAKKATEKVVLNPQVLNKYELQILSGIFDCGDTNGDHFLSDEELIALIEKEGGIDFILVTLGWLVPNEKCPKYKEHLKAVHKLLDCIHQTIITKLGNAVTFDQFVFLMTQFLHLQRQ